MRNYITALNDGNGYQWICEHGHELSKNELCDIIKEFTYDLRITNCQRRYQNVANSLEQIYEEE